jgi:hypothetical protein
VLVAIDTGSRRPVKILRARPTRHFLFLLVRCRCGKKFGHRADRPTIVCYECGRMAALRELRGRRGPGNGHATAKRAANSSRAKAASSPKSSRLRGVASRAVRRTAPTPAKRQSSR